MSRTRQTPINSNTSAMIIQTTRRPQTISTLIELTFNPLVRFRLGRQVQSWDIRGTTIGPGGTMAIVLPGGERSPAANRDRL